MPKYNPVQYWNTRGQNYSHPESLDELINLMRLISDYNKSITNILDIGSGDGRVYDFLKAHSVDKKLLRNYKMCDIADSFITECEKRTGVRPDKWAGVTLPYGDNKFDLVVSFSVALHVQPENIEQFLAEHVRVCNKYLFIATWYEEDYKNPSPHCFMHDYSKLFKDNSLSIVSDYSCYMKGNKCRRKNWLLETA